MRLLELRLQNFRQHADTTISFRSGLTGIIGPNGAGKSTLLEALAWAIYGAEAARGTNETLRFARAGARTRVEVELRFALADREYRVVRSLSSAEVFLDGGPTPVATTLGGVTRYLQQRLGMNRREFFNTYFTGQKELQFLAAMGPADRGRFLSTVLGYEKLRRAQDLARTRRNELRHEIDALRANLPDPDALRAERERVDAALAAAQEGVAAAERAHAEAAEALALLAPRWAESQGVRDRHRQLTSEIELADRERDAARRDLSRIEAELERVAAAERERSELGEQLSPLPSVISECERLAELARRNERRKALAEQAAEIEQELERSRERLERLLQAPELMVRYGAELAEARAEHDAAQRELEERKTAWLRDRQDAETKLQAFRDQASELQEHIQQIRDAGPEGKCPTCQRPLGKDFERMLGELEEQFQNRVQDGKWWKSRHAQLQGKPAEVVALEGRVEEAERAVAEKTRRHTRCESGVQELDVLQKERGVRAERGAQLRGELESIPTGYDPDEHRRAEARLRELRALETRVARLDEVASQRSAREREREEARERDQAAMERAARAAADREALGFSETAFAELRVRHDDAAERRRVAEIRATEQRGALANARLGAENAARAEDQYRRRLGDIEAREADHRHHNELDAAFSQLRADLNAQVRPELGEIASLFLAQLTDGRYTSLEIDDDYNLCVLDEGEEKPVISGGEEDVANLVLRLSLSQMIAERAGYPLSLLILDEVFGSLDVARRDNVVHLLRRLEDRFEQVILITHIDGLRENLDQIVHVAYDERTGASVVREETLPGPEDPVQDAAAD